MRMKCFFISVFLIFEISLSAESLSGSKIVENILDIKQYQEIQISYDSGTVYELQQKKGNSYYLKNDYGGLEKSNLDDENEIYKARDEGKGIGLQYIIGYGVFDYFNWNRKYFCGLGLLLDTKYVYSRESSIGMAGAGINFQMFWILDLSVGLGYAKFSDKMLYIDSHYNDGTGDIPVYSKKSIDGVYLFGQLGLKIPYNNKYDIFMIYDMNAFNYFSKTFKEASWSRESFRFGIGYKF